MRCYEEGCYKLPKLLIPKYRYAQEIHLLNCGVSYQFFKISLVPHLYGRVDNTYNKYH